MFPPSSPLSRLHDSYDGMIPPAWRTLAEAGSYDAYRRIMAHAAEQLFTVKIHETRRVLATWRLNPSPEQPDKLRQHAKIMRKYRDKAREAFDLCA